MEVDDKTEDEMPLSFTEAEWKTSEEYYREEIANKERLLIADPDGFHRKHEYASFFWYFIPISYEQYVNRKHACSLMSYDRHPKTPLFSRDKALFALWQFMQLPQAQLLIKVQGWKLNLSDEERVQMESWSKNSQKLL